MNPAAGEEKPKSDMPSGLIPGHKQSIVLFLERVYGIETRELFFKILEEAFLPDLRAATMLDRVNIRQTLCYSIRDQLLERRIVLFPLLISIIILERWIRIRHGVSDEPLHWKQYSTSVDQAFEILQRGG